MSVTLQVSPLPEADEESIEEIVINHLECDESTFSPREDILNRNVVLRCNCGLEVTLFDSKGSIDALYKTAIGSEPAKLHSGSYISNVLVDAILLAPVD